MLDMVLDKMTKFNVRLKLSKCSFGMTSVEFLGHIFDEYGVHFYPNVRSFIREEFCVLVNYFRNFIPSLSSYLQPLTELTKKRNFGEIGFEMTENALSSFTG